MGSLPFRISDKLYSLLFQQSEGVEPMLVCESSGLSKAGRVFLVWYVLGEGGGTVRPIFKNQLTGYDCETETLYPTQVTGLEGLQSNMEPTMYGSSDAQLVRESAQNILTGDRKTIRIIRSDALISKLVDLYQFAW